MIKVHIFLNNLKLQSNNYNNIKSTGTVRRFLEKNIDVFQVVVFVVEPIDEVCDFIIFQSENLLAKKFK